MFIDLSLYLEQPKTLLFTSLLEIIHLSIYLSIYLWQTEGPHFTYLLPTPPPYLEQSKVLPYLHSTNPFELVMSPEFLRQAPMPLKIPSTNGGSLSNLRHLCLLAPSISPTLPIEAYYEGLCDQVLEPQRISDILLPFYPS